MLEKLVTYSDLSPLLASNKTLINMKDEDYESFMDDWTEKAQAAPYVKEAVWGEQKRKKAVEDAYASLLTNQ